MNDPVLALAKKLSTFRLESSLTLGLGEGSDDNKRRLQTSICSEVNLDSI